MKYFFRIILIIFLSTNLYSCKKETIQPQSPSQPQITTIFHDDFVDNRYGWYQRNDSAVLVAIKNDSLFFTNKNIYPAFTIWDNMVLDQSKNFSIKASITKKSGVSNYGFGLNWGKSDTKNQFTFLIDQNGYFLIDKWQNGVSSMIANWTWNSAIYNNGANLLEVRKESNNLIFKVNGTQVYTTPFQSFMGNGIGFEVDNNIGMAVNYIDITQW